MDKEKSLNHLDFVHGTFSRSNDWRYQAWLSSESSIRNFSISTCLLKQKEIEEILNHDYEKKYICEIKSKSYFVSADHGLVENFERLREFDSNPTNQKKSIDFNFPFNVYDKEIVKFNYSHNKEFYYNFLLNEYFNKNTYACNILIMHHREGKPKMKNGFFGEWWAENVLDLHNFLNKELKDFNFYLKYHQTYDPEPFHFLK